MEGKLGLAIGFIDGWRIRTRASLRIARGSASHWPDCPEHQSGTGTEHDDNEEEEARLGVDDKTNAAEDLDNHNGDSDPEQPPGPLLAGVIEKRDDGDEKRNEDDSHGGGLHQPPSPASVTMHGTRDGTEAIGHHPDRIEKEVKGDQREQQADAEKPAAALGISG